jgi:hypothetical protein
MATSAMERMMLLTAKGGLASAGFVTKPFSYPLFPPWMTCGNFLSPRP